MSAEILSRIIVVIVLFVGVSSGGEIKDVIYDGLEMIEGGDIMKIDVQPHKIGPTKFDINGTLKHFKLFDDNWKIHFDVIHNKNIGVKPILFQYPSNDGVGICEFLKNEYKTYFYETLKDYSNAPHYETCPLVAKEYIVTNYPFDVEIFKKYLVPGGYEVIMVMQQSDDVVKYRLSFFVT